MADTSSLGTATAGEETTISDTLDEVKAGTPSSFESTPEPNAESAVQDPAQPQKRKGGRKPVSPLIAKYTVPLSALKPQLSTYSLCTLTSHGTANTV